MEGSAPAGVLARPAAPARTNLGGWAVIAVAALLPLFVTNAYYLLLLSFAGVYVLAAAGFNVIGGYVGIISIAHGALICMGAYTTAILSVTYGWSFWPAAVASASVSLLASGLVALPALRLSSWYFVLLTIAFTTAVTALATDLRALTGGFHGIVGIPPPALFGHAFTTRDMLWLIVALNAATWWAISNLVRSRVGWSWRAVRDPNICATNGVSVAAVRLVAFLISGGIAGLAGALFAVLNIVITPDDFPLDFSFFFLIATVLGGSGTSAGPLLGVLAFYILPEMLGSFQQYRMIVYGAGLLLFSVLLPEGIAGGLATLARRYGPAARAEPRVTAAARHSVPSLAPIDGAGLAIRRLSKRFGGVQALDGVSLGIAPGEIHAIVGPNGSGKTTLLNMISGLYPATSGTVRLDGAEFVGRKPQHVARAGVRRTFQTPKLLGGLTVLENVRFGTGDREQASGIEIALRLPRARAEAAALDREAWELLALVGLAARAGDKAQDLPHGQQRLLEIARALISRPRLLLLDEPAAGLSLGELERLRDLMQAIRRLGVTLVMVEHHIELVADVARSVTVLDQGRVLVDGPPGEVFRHPDVISAYTGVRA